MTPEVITTALSGVISNVTAIITAATPLVLGVIGTMAGVNVGFKLFKKFTSKAA